MKKTFAKNFSYTNGDVKNQLLKFVNHYNLAPTDYNLLGNGESNIICFYYAEKELK